MNRLYRPKEVAKGHILELTKWNGCSSIFAFKVLLLFFFRDIF